MGRDFNKVAPTIWQAASFKALPSDDHRYLCLYLMTCPHQNSAGCFTLPDGYACVDLGGWTTDKYRETLKALVDADLVEVDHETSEVRIKDWFRENCPMNDSHRKGTLRIIAAIKSTTLKDATQAALNEAWGALVASRNPLDGRAGNVSSAVLQSMAARRTGQ